MEVEGEKKKKDLEESPVSEGDAAEGECPCGEDCKSADDHEILDLKAKILILESQLENVKREQNEKILEFVEKKSKEAASIIEAKEQELSEKYRREFDEKIKFFYSKPLSELVNIVAQFEVVIQGITDPSVSGYLSGFKMFLSQFDSLFSSFSIVPIVPKEGDEFDSDIMEASSTKVVSDAKLDNKITNVFRKGYKLHDRVIKLSSVEVGQVRD